MIYKLFNDNLILDVELYKYYNNNNDLYNFLKNLKNIKIKITNGRLIEYIILPNFNVIKLNAIKNHMSESVYFLIFSSYLGRLPIDFCIREYENNYVELIPVEYRDVDQRIGERTFNYKIENKLIYKI